MNDTQLQAAVEEIRTIAMTIEEKSRIREHVLGSSITRSEPANKHRIVSSFFVKTKRFFLSPVQIKRKMRKTVMSE